MVPTLRVKPTAEGQGVVLLRVVEGHPLLQVCSRRDHLSKSELAVPLRNVGLREEGRGLLASGQVEAPLHQLVHRL
jgi:hypothetical protein